MRKWMIAGVVALALAGAQAQAQGVGAPPGGGAVTVTQGPAYVEGGYGGAAYGYAAPGSHFSGTGKFWSRGFFGGHPFSSKDNLTRMPTLPVFMAAPWYNYWPYDGHFQTVAPIASGAFYPPPAYTGNPFMPGRYPGYVPGAGVPTFPVR